MSRLNPGCIWLKTGGFEDIIQVSANTKEQTVQFKILHLEAFTQKKQCDSTNITMIEELKYED